MNCLLNTLTPEEAWRIHRQLSPEQVETLLESHRRLEQIDGIEAHISEAKGQFPDEGFLDELIDELKMLEAEVRGKNKETVKKLIEQAGNLQTTATNAADYGLEELNKALKTLKEN